MIANQAWRALHVPVRHGYSPPDVSSKFQSHRVFIVIIIITVIIIIIIIIIIINIIIIIIIIINITNEIKKKTGFTLNPQRPRFTPVV